VTTQVLAKTIDEAICSVSQLTQIPVNSIAIYRRSEEHLNTYERIQELSSHGSNIVASKKNIFFPLLFFPGGYGLQNFNRYRKIRHLFPQDTNAKYFTNFVV
jgi:hypothetical protein